MGPRRPQQVPMTSRPPRPGSPPHPGDVGELHRRRRNYPARASGSRDRRLGGLVVAHRQLGAGQHPPGLRGGPIPGRRSLLAGRFRRRATAQVAQGGGVVVPRRRHSGRTSAVACSSNGSASPPRFPQQLEDCGVGGERAMAGLRLVDQPLRQQQGLLHPALPRSTRPRGRGSPGLTVGSGRRVRDRPHARRSRSDGSPRASQGLGAPRGSGFPGTGVRSPGDGHGVAASSPADSSSDSSVAYFGSPRIGCPRASMWARSWWVRPVCG